MDQKRGRDQFIIQEIYSTEDTFVKNMQAFVEGVEFAVKKAKARPILSSLSKSDLQEIEVGLEAYKELANPAATSASASAKSDSPEAAINLIADRTNVLNREMFKQAAMIQAQGRFKDLLVKLDKSHKALAKVREIQKEKHVSLSSEWDAILIQPVQRVPRYQMLLTDLEKACVERDPKVSGNAKKVCDRVVDVAKEMNAAVGQVEAQQASLAQQAQDKVSVSDRAKKYVDSAKEFLKTDVEIKKPKVPKLKGRGKRAKSQKENAAGMDVYGDLKQAGAVKGKKASGLKDKLGLKEKAAVAKRAGRWAKGQVSDNVKKAGRDALSKARTTIDNARTKIFEAKKKVKEETKKRFGK